MGDEKTRRAILRTTGVAFTVGIAGCGANSTSSKVNAAKGDSRTSAGTSTTQTATGRTTTQRRTTEPSTETPTEAPTGTQAETPENTTADGNETTQTTTPEEASELELEEPDMVLHKAPLPSNPESKRYPTMGSDDAPLKVTFYGGWKCPYTRKFVTGFLNTLVRKYVLTGKIQLTFQFVAYDDGEGFHGPDEPMVARTGYAVWHSDPESFFHYMEYMYANQHRESGWYTIDKLVAIAQAADASTAKWLRYANESEKYQQPVEDTMDDVRAIPIESIPRLYISPEQLGRDGEEEAGEDTVGELMAPNLSHSGTISHLDDAIQTVKSDSKSTTTTSDDRNSIGFLGGLSGFL